MSILLDTMVVSELRRLARGAADPSFAAWARQVTLSSAFLSVLTIHELEVGVQRLERRDAAGGQKLREWLEQMESAFADRVLTVDARVARIAAGYHVPDPAPTIDALIAATAVLHDLPVATRNTCDFARFGVPLVNPWDSDES